MTTADIERMAREAGMTQDGLDWFTDDCDVSTGALTRFAALVRAQALEDAARLCDVTPPQPFRPSIEAAHAIRALKDRK